MTPAEFHPEFTEGLRAANNTINPRFCLTDSSALDLQALLASNYVAKIVQLHPLTGQNVAPKVPWMQFATDSNSVNINAGQLADSFMHGKPPDLAFQEMLGHIDQTIADQTSGA